MKTRIMDHQNCKTLCSKKNWFLSIVIVSRQGKLS